MFEKGTQIIELSETNEIAGACMINFKASNSIYEVNQKMSEIETSLEESGYFKT